MQELKTERLGMINKNKQDELMKIVKYNNARDIVVEFQDEYKDEVHTNWYAFRNGIVRNPHKYKTRLNSENFNYQGCLMKVVEYKNCSNLIIEFQDNFKFKKKSTWANFINGSIKNPYYPEALGVGMIGAKYPTTIGKSKHNKEYSTWFSMLTRCFNERYKNIQQTYKEVTCCNEWLLYENFYEWLHSQENFDKWFDGERWAIDKDILIKGNKIYSPRTCCLVPLRVNTLFVKNDINRGEYPIGVSYYEWGNVYSSSFQDGNHRKTSYFKTKEEAFSNYKIEKEKLIKQIAQEEYDKNNITKKCYEAMMNYEVEITD